MARPSFGRRRDDVITADRVLMLCDQLQFTVGLPLRAHAMASVYTGMSHGAGRCPASIDMRLVPRP
eukprot:6212091-Pleurochrysis_carterae.AAC.4